MKSCEMDGCGKRHYARGWCNMHYMRWRSHGDPSYRMRLVGEDPAVRFASKVRPGPGCWEWQAGKSVDGYGGFHIGDEHIPAHRYAWQLEYGEIPAGMCVLHHCDNPGCVRPSHLFLGTRADNIADMVAKGRQRSGAHLIPNSAKVRGEAHHQAKLKDDDVLAIRRLYAAGGVSQAALGGQFGVSQEIISGIVRRVGWAHVRETRVSLA